MKIEYSDALIEYMNKKNKKDIIVELVECNNSEIEIAELHVYPADKAKADFFINKKGYGICKTEFGRVLFPRMKLDLEDIIYFDIKKVIFFNILKYKGIHI